MYFSKFFCECMCLHFSLTTIYCLSRSKQLSLFIRSNNFILKGANLLDHTSIFLLLTINHCVILIIRILSWFVLTGTSSEFFPPKHPLHWDIPTRSLDIPLGYGLSWNRLTSNLVLECELLWTYNPARSFNVLLGYRVFQT